MESPQIQEIYIIAEIGSTHDGSFGNALRLIDTAAECGVDAVKFQTHIAECETVRDAPNPAYFKDEPRFEYFQRTAFNLDQWLSLRARCEEKGVDFISSPFSLEAVDLLEAAGVVRYKIPSGEITNLPLLEKAAKTQKPIILSSGMSSWEELDRAVECTKKQTDKFSILQCTSEYPCPYEAVGLNIMQEMRKRYGCPVGLSDHTLTNYASLAAASLGAEILERHLTFSRKMYGSDAKHSLEPQDLANLVQGVRAIETMLANPVDKSKIEKFREMKNTFEKSIVSLEFIPKGTPITFTMLGLKKPGTGIPSMKLAEVIGRVASRDIKQDTLICWDDLEPA